MTQPTRSTPGQVPRSAALALLAAGWVALYWWWEPRRQPPITFASVRPAAQTPGPAREPPAAPPEPTPEPSRAEPAPVPPPAPPAKAEEPPPPAVPAREYVVQRGDTLSGISKRFYGTTRYADLLYRANRAGLKLRSPDAITAGDVLVIPPPPDRQER